jgi:hypothetical protein
MDGRGGGGGEGRSLVGSSRMCVVVFGGGTGGLGQAGMGGTVGIKM